MAQTRAAQPLNAGGRRKSPFVLAMIALLAFALVYRFVRYAMGFEVIMDETFILNNVLVKDYAQLLDALANGVSPPLLLWMWKCLLDNFPGDWAVRLPSVLASVAALLLYFDFCRLTLRGTARWLAPVILGLTWVPIAYSTRAKPYSFDLLVSVVILSLAMRALMRPSTQARWVLILALLSPVMLWSSYPAVFMIGGVLLALGWRFVRSRDRRSTGMFFSLLLLAVISAGSWLLLNHLNISKANATAQAQWAGFWASSMPSWTSLSHTLWWLVDSHTGRSFSWPIGDDKMASTGTCLLWLAGMIHWYRNRDRRVMALLLGPQALVFLAACLQRYPYSGDPRVNIFLGPGICFFAAVGAASLLRKIAPPHRNRVMAASVILLGAIAGGIVVKDSLALNRERQTLTIPRLIRETAQTLGGDGLIRVAGPCRALAVGAGPAVHRME